MKKIREYHYFMAALNREIETRGWGAITELASASGVTPAYLSRVRSGDEAPSFKRQAQIAKACGKTYIEFLLTGKNIITKSGRRATDIGEKPDNGLLTLCDNHLKLIRSLENIKTISAAAYEKISNEIIAWESALSAASDLADTQKNP